MTEYLKLSETSAAEYTAERNNAKWTERRSRRNVSIARCLDRLWWKLYYRDQRAIFQATRKHEPVTMSKRTEYLVSRGTSTERWRLTCPVCPRKTVAEAVPVICNGSGIAGPRSLLQVTEKKA